MEGKKRERGRQGVKGGGIGSSRGVSIVSGSQQPLALVRHRRTPLSADVYELLGGERPFGR